jgi:nitrogen-specific signal transduction histidine kinase
MVPHSLDGAYSESGSQILWEDGERIFRRGWRLDDNGKRLTMLIVQPAVEPGIDRTLLDRVFEAFYTTKPTGTGMDCRSAGRSFNARGGRLWAEANEPRGVIFKFTLPAVQVEP